MARARCVAVTIPTRIDRCLPQVLRVTPARSLQRQVTTRSG
jgi:hypothetical protein